MKATILLAVCVFCAESKLESNFNRASSLNLHSLIGTAVRHKRQVQEPAVCSGEDVFRRGITAVCGPNIGQSVLDIYMDCNHNDDYTIAIEARRFIGSCSRNENERFCSEFQLQLFKYTNPLQSNCPYLNTYSDYNCTVMCHAALQSLKSNVGCCLNSFFNISGYRQFNNAGLWSACSVSPPGFCQATNLTLSSGTTSRNCSSVDIVEQIYAQIICNAQIYQPVLDIYQQCESPEYEFLIAQCGLSETNQFCALLIANDTHPRAVESQCQNYTEGCNPSCYAALNSFKTALGCCVNFYNNSIYYGIYRNTTNPDLWSACGIPTPGFCPSTLVSQPTTSSESNAALRLDFLTMVMLAPIVLLNMLL